MATDSHSERHSMQVHCLQVLTRFGRSSFGSSQLRCYDGVVHFVRRYLLGYWTFLFLHSADRPIPMCGTVYTVE